MIAQDLIKSSLRLCGVGQPSIPQLNNGLEVLNLMLGLWGTERLIIYYNVRENFNLTIGKGSYTIGSSESADFNTSRPNKIESAFIRDSGGIDYPLDVTMTEREYDWMTNKSVSNRPSTLFYYPSYPLGKIFFDSIPSLVEAFYLSSLKSLNSISDLDTSVSLPSEYEKAIKFNLAVDLAPEYDAVLDPTVLQQASLSKLLIENLNASRFGVPTASFERDITLDLVR